MPNLSQSPSGTLAASSASRFIAGASAASCRLPIYLACTIFALTINYALGKELAWDTLNHHLYSGFSAIHDRFAQDYFAAGPQAYLNPYAYVPFYTMVAAGLPALAIASVLAVLQSAILWLTFELALVVSPSGPWTHRVTFATCCVVLAALNPVLLQQLGTSFTDLTTAELVLGGWLLLAMAVRAPSAWRIIGAATLLGAATALKLTNGVHAASAAVILLFLPLPFAARLRFAAGYVLTLAVSFALAAAPWSYRLEKTFGNPFFPLANGIFRSPEFTTEPLHHLRFVPSNFLEALWRPFAMVDPWAMVHEELRAPDLRYAVLFLLALALAGIFLARRLRARPVQAAATVPAAYPTLDHRVLTALAAVFVSVWVLWLTNSGNSRYLLPLACLVAVLVIGLLFDIFRSWPKARNYLLAVLFLSQTLQVSMGGELRWDPGPWGGQWFDVKIPPALAQQPNLYLMVGVRSMSFLAPYLPPDSGFIDISGSYPLEATGATGRRVHDLIQRYAPHLRLVVTGERLYADAERRAPSVSGMNTVLQRFGLRVDPSECSTIVVRAIGSDMQFGSPQAVSAVPRLSPLYLASCGLVADHEDHSADLVRQRTANMVLDRLEDACPELFQPRRSPTGRYAEMWRRIYLNTDLVAWVSRDEVKFFDPARGDGTVYLGSESAWAAATPPRLVCGRRNGHYFAKVQNQSEMPTSMDSRAASSYVAR